MAGLQITAKTFRTIVIILSVLVVLLIAGIVLLYAAPGLTAMLHPASPQGGSVSEPENGPWGTKTFTWEYGGGAHTAIVSISKETYQALNRQTGADISGLITAEDGGAIAYLASQITEEAAVLGFSEEDTVGLALSFARSIAYSPDSETGHSSAFPRAPAVTLADGTGDSADLSILASSLLENMGYASAVLSYPPVEKNGHSVPAAAALGLPGNPTGESPLYTHQNRTLSAVWIADTAEQGYPAYAYYIEEPEIFAAPSFLSGKIPVKAEAELPTADVFSIPEASIHPDTSWTVWRGKAAEYYESGWSASGIIWTADDKWKLYEHSLTVPANQRTGEFTAGSLWRLTYTVNILPDDTQNGMTPYSNADIVLYKIVGGKPQLLETFGWQGTSDASPRGKSLVYPPGEYAVGVFVRNTDVTAAVEYSGSAESAPAGGI